MRWHRELVRRKWAAFGKRPRRVRPAMDPEVIDLILRLASENPRWGYRRIQGELLKLGRPCSHVTVRKVMRLHRVPPACGVQKSRSSLRALFGTVERRMISTG